MATRVRLYTDGHKWYIQDLLLCNIIGHIINNLRQWMLFVVIIGLSIIKRVRTCYTCARDSIILTNKINLSMKIKSTMFLEYYSGEESELLVVREKDNSSNVFLTSDEFIEYLRSLPEKENG